MNTKPRIRHRLHCQHCGDPFTGDKRQRYCGTRCAGLANHPGNVALDCPVCGRGFEISAQYAAGGTCSRACGRYARLYPGRKRATHCGRCQQPITRSNINAIYCSPLCAAAGGQARRDGRTACVPRQFCLSCGGPLVGRTARALYCKRACQAIAGKERRAAKIAGARVERVYPIDIYERDEWTCHCCGGPIDPTLTQRYDPLRISLDHIIAVNAPDFPGHVWENLATAHLRCNIAKGDAVTAADRALYARLAAVRQATV
jgi:HNH endonuclease